MKHNLLNYRRGIGYRNFTKLYGEYLNPRGMRMRNEKYFALRNLTACTVYVILDV